MMCKAGKVSRQSVCPHLMTRIGVENSLKNIALVVA